MRREFGRRARTACAAGALLAGIGLAGATEPAMAMGKEGVQQYLRVEVDGKLSSQAKDALARVLSETPDEPDAPAQGTKALRDGAASGSLSLDALCQRGLCAGAPVSPPQVTIGDPPAGLGTPAQRRRLSLDPSQLRTLQRRAVRGSAAGDIDAPILRLPSPEPVIGPPALPGTGPTRDLIVLEPRNPLREILADQLEGAGIDEEQTALVPLPPDLVARDAVFPDDASDAATPRLGSIVVNAPAAPEIARLERDLEQFETTSRTVPWQGTEIDPETEAELAAPGVRLERIVVGDPATAGGGTDGGAGGPDDPPDIVPGQIVESIDALREVDVDWAEVVGQSEVASADGGGGGGADGGGAEACAVDPLWPQDAGAVAARIAFALDVLEAMGQGHPRRSNVLVVDSGVSEAVARHLGHALYVDTAELLGPGAYVHGTGTAEPLCDYPNGEATDVAFGYAPDGDARVHDECTSARPLHYLAPPPVPDPPGSYRPEHGGYVGVLAAGGDLLERGSGADRLVGVSFARIMWSRGEGTPIASDASDVRDAIAYATRKGVDVVNASLAIRGARGAGIARDLQAYMEGGGLVVAAAGNAPGELRQSTSNFPGSIASDGGQDHLIIVSGLRWNGTDVEHWPSSAHSSTLVDIAAPAERVASMGMEGEPLCMSGTSASAPQVAFVAAALKALGMRSAAEVKRRILATADLRPDLLGEHVRDGRILNAARALDVFTDLVWVDDAREPRRVHIAAEEGAGPGLSVRACAGNFAQLGRGRVDLGRLLSWRRLGDGRAEVWFRTGGDPKLSPIDSICEAPRGDPSDLWRLMDPATGEIEEVAFERIARIVPSRFRSALPRARTLMASR